MDYTAAASPFYNVGTILEVYNPATGLQATVLVNDCTPYGYDGGTFDISWQAALDIGLAPYQGRSYDMVVWPVGYVPGY